jgi:hypothetical protein
MAQVSHPIADVNNTGWSPSPLYPHVNSVTPNDGSPVKCLVPPGGSFDVQMQPLSPPAPGPQILTVRLNEAAPGDTLVSFFLLQVTQSGVDTVAGASVQVSPAAFPEGWSGWENVRQAHVRLLEQAIERCPPYPAERFRGRGIVTCVTVGPTPFSGKGLPQGYLPGAWVLVNELRRRRCP